MDALRVERRAGREEGLLLPLAQGIESCDVWAGEDGAETCVLAETGDVEGISKDGGGEEDRLDILCARWLRDLRNGSTALGENCGRRKNVNAKIRGRQKNANE